MPAGGIKKWEARQQINYFSMAADFFNNFKLSNERDDVREYCSTFAKVIISRPLRQKNHHNLIFQIGNAILLSHLSDVLKSAHKIPSNPKNSLFRRPWNPIFHLSYQAYDGGFIEI
jgi:hypothetical protein